MSWGAAAPPAPRQIANFQEKTGGKSYCSFCTGSVRARTARRAANRRASRASASSSACRASASSSVGPRARRASASSSVHQQACGQLASGGVARSTSNRSLHTNSRVVAGAMATAPGSAWDAHTQRAEEELKQWPASALAPPERTLQVRAPASGVHRGSDRGAHAARILKTRARVGRRTPERTSTSARRTAYQSS